MQLSPIQENQFPLWKSMREQVYPSLDSKFHDQEMRNIFTRNDYYCYFIENADKKSPSKEILGMVEISARNVVDGCLSSPVAYIEGLFVKKEFQGEGVGKETISAVKSWCKKNGFSELALDAELTNVAAQNFFKHVGFQESYRIVEFKTNIV